MSLAVSHDEIVSAPMSTRSATARKATVDLAFILAFVAFAIVSIFVVATQPSAPEIWPAVTAFAGP